MSDSPKLLRKRSTSTLAQTISFTHTRQNNRNLSDDEDLSSMKSPMTSILTNNSNTSNKNLGSPFGNFHRNSSSSTLHSITRTLSMSNVGFNSITPIETSASTITNSSSSQPHVPSSLSPTALKKDNALSRAKLFAKTKTKELTRTNSRAKSDTDRAHHKFLKKSGYHGLSSSSSNSKLETGSTLYSFDPSSIMDNDSLVKQVLNESNLRFLSFEEKDQIADNLWAIITSMVMPLFRTDSRDKLKLKAPVEELNSLLEAYLRLRIENNIPASSIISEIQEFLRNGLNILENELSFNENISELEALGKIALTWGHFYQNIYHYLLGILLPLQLEFDSLDGIVKSPKSYWNEASQEIGLSTRKLILISFRDFVVLPYFELEVTFPKVYTLEKKKLIQCFGLLKSIQSNSYNQKIVDYILMILQQPTSPLYTN